MKICFSSGKVIRKRTIIINCQALHSQPTTYTYDWCEWSKTLHNLWLMRVFLVFGISLMPGCQFGMLCNQHTCCCHASKGRALRCTCMHEGQVDVYMQYVFSPDKHEGTVGRRGLGGEYDHIKGYCSTLLLTSRLYQYWRLAWPTCILCARENTGMQACRYLPNKADCGSSSTASNSIHAVIVHHHQS